MKLTAAALGLLALSTASFSPAAAAEPAGCTGVIDAADQAVPFCNSITVSGSGGEEFDLVVDADTVLDLGVSGDSPDRTYLRNLQTSGDSPVIGLLIHQPLNSAEDPVDLGYVAVGRHTVEASGGYMETSASRGFEADPPARTVVVPAGEYRVRLLANGTPVTATLTLGDQPGSVTVDPRLGAASWTDLELEYGNSSAGGMGATIDQDVPTFTQMNVGWTAPVYQGDVTAGFCGYDRPVTTSPAYAPGCPDQFVGDNSANNISFSPNGPDGSRITWRRLGGPVNQSAGIYHVGLMAMGQMQGYLLEVPLT